MIHEMIALPLRLGVRATRCGVLLAGSVVVAALRTGEALIDAATPELHAPSGPAAPPVAARRIGVGIVLRPRPSTVEPPAAAPARPHAAEPAPAADGATPRPRTETPAPAAGATPEAPAAPKSSGAADHETPAHVTQEPRLVATSADPGAEDGVGATVHVAEPWNGYADMTAKEVVARMAHAGREELATVELYEQGHAGRRTVLTAADRRLRRATAASAAAA